MSDLRSDLFSAKGRLGRWDWIVWTMGLGFAGGVALEVETLPLGWVAGLLLYPKVCVHANRLHDLGLSAWWQTPAFLVGAAALYYGGYEPLGRAFDTALRPWPPLAHPAVALTLMCALLAYWLILAFAPGQKGPNRYGPRPDRVSPPAEASRPEPIGHVPPSAT